MVNKYTLFEIFFENEVFYFSVCVKIALCKVIIHPDYAACVGTQPQTDAQRAGKFIGAFIVLTLIFIL